MSIVEVRTFIQTKTFNYGIDCQLLSGGELMKTGITCILISGVCYVVMYMQLPKITSDTKHDNYVSKFHKTKDKTSMFILSISFTLIKVSQKLVVRKSV